MSVHYENEHVPLELSKKLIEGVHSQPKLGTKIPTSVSPEIFVGDNSEHLINSESQKLLPKTVLTK